MSAHVFKSHHGRVFCALCGCEARAVEALERGARVRKPARRRLYRNSRGDWQRVPPPCAVEVPQ